MLRLHEAPVGPEEIDNLGHMNMRYYSVRAAAATEALLASWGFGAEALKAQGLVLTYKDVFNHYMAEQFAGATLVVDGGVAEAGPDGITFYQEITNPKTGARAATFILKPVMQTRLDRQDAPLPKELVARAKEALIDLPAHAAPRTLSLATPNGGINFKELSHKLAGRGEWPNHMRVDVAIPADVCDDTGHMVLSGAQDIMMMSFQAMSKQFSGDADFRKRMPAFPVIDGKRIAWAMLENRQYLFSTPRVGDKIRMLSAPLRLGAKTQEMRRWTFNATTGALFAVIDGVSLAFDLEARRSLEIPPQLRREMEAQMLHDAAHAEL